MSADKNLSLGVGLDRSAASAGAAKLREEFKDLNRRMLSDAETAKAAEMAITQRTNEERIRSAVAAADREKAIEQMAVNDWQSLRKQMVADEKTARAELSRSVKDGADESKRSLQEMGSGGKTSLADIGIGAGAAIAGIRTLVGFARELRAELEKAGEAKRGLTAGLVGSREANRELMTLEGETDDNKFAINLRRFAKQSAMTEAEARTFRLGARETGGVGRDILGKETYDAALQHAAGVTPAVGIDPTLAGRMMGGMITSSPQLARLPQAQRVASLNQSFDRVIGTLQQAPGNLGDLTRNYQESAAGNLQKESPLFGMFKSPEELAQVIGVTGYLNPQTGREQVEASIRGLQDDKAKPLLQKAGITPGMPYQEQMKRLAPVLMQEAQKRGTSADVVSGDYFEDIRTRRAILNQIQNGVLGGGYESIGKGGMANAAGLPGKVTAFQASDTGRRRIAEESVSVAEAEAGAEGSDVDILRLQATEQLRREGKLGASVAMQNFLINKVGFGLLPDPDKTRINARVQEMIQQRTGGKIKGSRSVMSVAGQDTELNTMAKRAREMKVDITRPDNAGAGTDNDEHLSGLPEAALATGGTILDMLGVPSERRHTTTDSRGPLATSAGPPVPIQVIDATPRTPAPLIGRPPIAERR